MTIQFKWPDFWELFDKAHPQARLFLGHALTQEGFDKWMKQCSDGERERALKEAPIEVALTYVGYFGDRVKAKKVALQYPRTFQPLLDSMWKQNTPENLRACLTVIRRLK